MTALITLCNQLCALPFASAGVPEPCCHRRDRRLPRGVVQATAAIIRRHREYRAVGAYGLAARLRHGLSRRRSPSAAAAAQARSHPGRVLWRGSGSMLRISVVVGRANFLTCRRLGSCETAASPRSDCIIVAARTRGHTDAHNGGQLGEEPVWRGGETLSVDVNIIKVALLADGYENLFPHVRNICSRVIIVWDIPDRFNAFSLHALTPLAACGYARTRRATHRVILRRTC